MSGEPESPRNTGSVSLEVAWNRGGTAVLVETDGGRVSVDSDVAAAPGTPLAGRVKGSALDGAPLLVKVRGCRRINQEPPLYRIEGRFVNLSSKERASLLAHVAKATKSE